MRILRIRADSKGIWDACDWTLIEDEEHVHGGSPYTRDHVDCVGYFPSIMGLCPVTGCIEMLIDIDSGKIIGLASGDEIVKTLYEAQDDGE